MEGSGGNAPLCAECGTAVHLMERVTVDRDAYHGGCFKCADCGQRLTTATFRRDRNRRLSCTKHAPGSPSGSPAPSRNRSIDAGVAVGSPGGERRGSAHVSSPSTMSPAAERRTSLTIGVGGRAGTMSPTLGSPRAPRSPRSPRGSCTGDSETLVTWRRVYLAAKQAEGLVAVRAAGGVERDDAFYADDMLAWLVSSGNAATRGDALGLCERLQLLGGLRPVAEGEPFRDAHELCTFTTSMLDGSEGPLSTTQAHRALRASLTPGDAAPSGPQQSPEEAVKQMIRRTDGWIIEDAPVSGPFPLPQAQGADGESSAYTLEHLDPDAGEYRTHFFGKDHGNYYATAELGGPAVISVKKEKVGAEEQFRVILRTMQKDYRGHVTVAAAVAADGRGKGRATIEGIAKVVSGGACAVERWQPAFHADVSDPIFKYDENGIVRQYKFGIVYGKDGQSTEEQMFGNCGLSPAFDDFLSIMGERVTLLGFGKYRAGLDVKYEMTGDKSVYTQFCRREVMFHVSTLLPFTEGDPQQVQRKRHIGNDIVSIIYHEGSTPFIPTCIKSHFLHVYIVVQPDVPPGKSLAPGKLPARYRVSVVKRDGVPDFGPAASAPTIIERGPALREYLLAKMMNGENASYKAPNFARLVLRTRNGLLRDMADTFSRCSGDDKSPAGAAVLKRTKAMSITLLDEEAAALSAQVAGDGAGGDDKPKNRLLDSLRTLRKGKTLSRTNSDDSALNSAGGSAPSSPSTARTPRGSAASALSLPSDEEQRRGSTTSVEGGGFKTIRHELEVPGESQRDRSKSDVGPKQSPVGRTSSLVMPSKPEKEKLSLAEMLFEMDQFDDDDGPAADEGPSQVEVERERKEAESDKKKPKAQLLQENKALRAHLAASEVEKARLHNRVSILGGDTSRLREENIALRSEIQALKQEAQKLKAQLKLVQRTSSSGPASSPS